jgi:hypothetical protein
MSSSSRERIWRTQGVRQNPQKVCSAARAPIFGAFYVEDVLIIFAHM